MPQPASPFGGGRSDRSLPSAPAPYVDRPRVREVLDAAHRTTVLRAPVGFGKTAAVTAWLHGADARSAGRAPGGRAPGGRAPGGRALVWHSLDAPPESSPSFWAAAAAPLAAALLPAAGAVAAAGADDPAASPGSTGSTGSATSTASTYDDVRALVATLDAPLLLVIDGLEAAVSTPTSDASPVGEITTELVDLLALSPHLDLLVTCRPYGPLAMDAIFGPGAQILDAAAFTLTPADTLDLASSAGVPLTLAQAHHLQAKLWGWPALTWAVLDRLGGSEAGYTDSSWEAGSDVLAAMDSEQIDPEVAHFIRQICILDPLTGPLASALTGSPYAGRALADLERSGLTRSHLLDGERCYTLLPAVLRAIRTRPAAAAEYAPAHRHAAKMFRDLPQHALRHAVLAQDWDLVVSIAEKAAVPLILDHPLALFRALAHVPGLQMLDHPGLLEVQAVLGRFDHEAIAPPTQLPPPGAALDASALHRVLTVATAQIIALRACHEDVAARDLVDRCIRELLVPANGSAASGTSSGTASCTASGTSSGTAVSLFFLHAGIAHCLVGQIIVAIDDFERSFELSRAAGLDSVTRAAAEYSALARALMGDTSGAREALERSRRYSHALVALQFVDVRLDQLVGALIALDQLDLATARLLLPPTDHSHRGGVAPAWFVDAHVRAHLCLLSGDLFSATTGLGRILRDRRTSLGRGTLSSRMLTATAATINVWGGNTTRAKNILDGIPRGALVNAVHADVALQMGDIQTALDITNRSLAADTVPDRLQIETLITRCVARARQGDRAGAAADLRLAIAVADPLLLRPFLAVPRPLLADIAGQAPEAADLLSRLEATGITLTPVEHHEVLALTEAEQDLLRALSTGASMDAIAARLGTTVPPALIAVGNLFQTLGVHDRLGAIAAGHMLGYLGAPGA